MEKFPIPIPGTFGGFITERRIRYLPVRLTIRVLRSKLNIKYLEIGLLGFENWERMDDI